MKRTVFLHTICYILTAAFLAGCATTTTSAGAGLKKTVTIEGKRYAFAEELAELYNVDYYWDPIAKKVVFSQNGKQAKMMVGSRTVLLGQKVVTIDKEVEFYQGSPVIPQSFAQRALAAFLKEQGRRPTLSAGSVLGAPIRRVIIDPGHGGKDPGAVGRGGQYEKDIVLSIAKKLKRRLSSMGIAATLTRSDDRFLTLGQRSRIANKENADFFISVHANASRSRWVSGVEVYYLSEAIDDDLRSTQAAKKYNLNLKEDYSGKYTEAILWDLTYQQNRNNSIDLAGLVCRSLSRNLSQRNRGNKPARFYVLKGTNIPAILIEVGFISNAREEKKLKGAAYQDKIAQAIAGGISQYNSKFSQKRYTRY
ncbi:N-acetylmuramoyl-L-alanine amidase [Candidatus Omnitrophota bacterium]